jgi:hypothetical protein
MDLLWFPSRKNQWIKMQPSFAFSNNHTSNNASSNLPIPSRPSQELHQQQHQHDQFQNCLTHLLSLSSQQQHLSPLTTLFLQEQALARLLPAASTSTRQYSSAEVVDEQKEEVNQKKRPCIITQPLPNDVLFGRGRPLQSHCGNLRFHRIINKFREQYKNARKDEKVGTREPTDAKPRKDPTLVTHMEVNALSHGNQGTYHSNCPGRGVLPRHTFSFYHRQPRRRQQDDKSTWSRRNCQL